MGLDQFLFAARRPGLKDDKVYSYKGLTQKGLSVYDSDDGNLPADLKDLEKFLDKVRCIAQYYDVEKVRDVFQMPSTPSVGCIAPNGVTFSCYNGEESVNVHVERANLHNYIREDEKVFFVTQLVEVAYWRKDYALSDKIHHAYPGPVENCGFYRMTPEMLEMIAQHNRDNKKNPSKIHDSGNIFYHEWY